MRKLLNIIFFLVAATVAVAQNVTQQVRGRITNNHGAALSNVNVRIVGESEYAAVTDGDGRFTVDVPVGRYKLTISHTGFQTNIQELLVIAAKQAVINTSLSPLIQELSAVEVSSTPTVLEAPGQRSLTIEKTLRMPANYFDPVRVAASYPGIVVANDQGNAIIVRGNSPNGLLWRLNGLDIVNPNHLANAGTFSDKPMANGGGVNILSGQMLNKTDFYTGAFPLNYGNALSGVVDMQLRDGNKEKKEYTAQASLLGLDVAAEGPIGQSKTTSFLANYRYSTVGLLSKIGVDFGGEVINFQDFSFHINQAGKNGSTLSVFGFGGLSSNDFNTKPENEWEEDKDRYTINYKSTTYAVGFNFAQPLTKGKLFIAAGFSSSDQSRKSNVSNEVELTETLLLSDVYQLTNNIFSSQIRYETNIARNVNWQLGVMTNYLDNNINSTKTFGCLICSFRSTSTVDGANNGVLVQPFTGVNVSLSPKLLLDGGIRYVSYTYNNTDAFEPRASLRYAATRRSAFQLSYGLTSQVQTPVVYATTSNNSLGLTKAHHVDLGNTLQLSNDLRIQSDVFYQYLFNVPVQSGDPFYSSLNLLEDISVPTLVDAGKGKNVGGDVTIEKQFYGKNYFLITGSYYESTYSTGNDNAWKPTRFNGKFTASVIHGKEWTNVEKRRAINVNTRVLYIGGMRYAPVNVAESMASHETVYDLSNGYSEQLNDYFRVDFRVSFRKNKPGYTRTFAIDIQNLLNIENQAYPYYDFVKRQVVMKNQLGIIPVLVYRIDF